jgi:hypothetical protein
LAAKNRLCVPKTSSELMTWWNRLSWRNDRTVPFRPGRAGLAIQVEDPRSLTSLTASILDSRLNLRLCMTTSGFMKTPNPGVHQTGSSSVRRAYPLRNRVIRLVTRAKS